MAHFKIVKTALMGHVCSHSKRPQHPTVGVHGATPVPCPAASVDTHVPSPPAAPRGGWGPRGEAFLADHKGNKGHAFRLRGSRETPFSNRVVCRESGRNWPLGQRLGRKRHLLSPEPRPGAWHETLRTGRTSVSLLPPSPGKLPGGRPPPKPREERSLPPGGVVHKQ